MTDVLADATRIPPIDAGRDAVLPCADAAALLEVAPTALTTWSQRLAFPVDVGGVGAPSFRRTEIEALRDALPLAHSVAGAVQAARTQVAQAQPRL